jgi:methionyl-tRNA formyltransferase
MKIFLCGQKHFGWTMLGVLRDLGHDVIGVAAPEGDRLYKSAYHSDVQFLIPGGHLREETMPEGADLIVAAHSYDFVGSRTLAKTRLGGIGYHPSLLPLHRGRSAIEWAIRMGDPVTGGSVYWLSKNVDGGPIAAQDYCFIPKGQTARELWERTLQPMGVRLFSTVLRDIESGRIVAVPQDESLATWEPSLDQPPLFRPDLPRIGSVEGYDVVTSGEHARPWYVSQHWKSIAGG